MNLIIVDDEWYAIQGILNGVQWDQLEIGTVFTAKSYFAAQEIFNSNQIDLMICDIEMPDLSGLELIEWTNTYFPETECIILSCHDEFDFARRAVSLNCLDYVLKPVPYDILTQVLKNALVTISERHRQSVLENYGKIYVNHLTEKAMITNEMKDGGNIVETVVKYIANHISDCLFVEDLANMVFVSPDHLTRSFKKEFNQTVTDYIMQQRMLMAARLLESTNISVTMISAAVGYGNYSYFIKLFKKYFGKTPRNYKRDKLIMNEKNNTSDI